MAEIQVCLHCGNQVEEIPYVREQQMPGEIVNKYRHVRPRIYAVCNKNPIMDEDVHMIDEESYGEDI